MYTCQVTLTEKIAFFRHNEDGSYSYGYEAADGSFKLETRYPDGRVKGKYGYIDIHTGELKVLIFLICSMFFTFGFCKIYTSLKVENTKTDHSKEKNFHEIFVTNVNKF